MASSREAAALAERFDHVYAAAGIHPEDCAGCTDADFDAIRELCRRAEVPVQRYSNRADLPGGSTLGNISTSHLSIPSVDIGLPQLAMHSCCEVAGVRDTEALARVMTVYFATGMHCLPGGGMALA